MKPFWPFPIFRIHPTSEALTRLFLDFARAPDLTFEANASAYYLSASCALGRIEFWNANHWYAWAGDGTFTNSAGVRTAWRGEMPSRYAVRRMRQAVGARQYGRRCSIAHRSQQRHSGCTSQKDKGPGTCKVPRPSDG